MIKSMKKKIIKRIETYTHTHTRARARARIYIHTLMFFSKTLHFYSFTEDSRVTCETTDIQNKNEKMIKDKHIVRLHYEV